MSENKTIGYYQSDIKTSRNEDSVYAIKYASQQALIDRLQQENQQLKEQLKQRDEVIDEISEFIEENGIDEKMASACNIYDVNGIEIYKILTKYKGDNNNKISVEDLYEFIRKEYTYEQTDHLYKLLKYIIENKDNSKSIIRLCCCEVKDNE